jgi:hypothetical protein
MYLKDPPMIIKIHMSFWAYPIKWDIIVAMATGIVTLLHTFSTKTGKGS